MVRLINSYICHICVTSNCDSGNCDTHPFGYCRADSRFAPSQWETSLQSNAVSHWLGANLESALYCPHWWLSFPYICVHVLLWIDWHFHTLPLGIGPVIESLKQSNDNRSINTLELGFNTLRPRQNGCHFPDNIFKCIFLIENVWISVKISRKFVPKDPINNIPALVQVMACRLFSTNDGWDFWRIYASLGLNEWK